jgi:hypothetical protein
MENRNMRTRLKAGVGFSQQRQGICIYRNRGIKMDSRKTFLQGLGLLFNARFIRMYSGPLKSINHIGVTTNNNNNSIDNYRRDL